MTDIFTGFFYFDYLQKPCLHPDTTTLTTLMKCIEQYLKSLIRSMITIIHLKMYRFNLVRRKRNEIITNKNKYLHNTL